MKRFLRRFLRTSDDWEQSHGFAALSQLVETAEPDPDLFARIEARIDAEASQAAVLPSPRPRRAFVLCLMVVVAIVSATVGHLIGPERQQVFAVPTASADQVPLGAVSLHGPALRAFLQSACKGHTHVSVLMYGVSVDDTTVAQSDGPTDESKKILVECIF